MVVVGQIISAAILSKTQDPSSAVIRCSPRSVVVARVVYRFLMQKQSLFVDSFLISMYFIKKVTEHS
jgi:hypothetical protein